MKPDEREFLVSVIFLFVSVVIIAFGTFLMLLSVR